jgi:hypothetical protein
MEIFLHVVWEPGSDRYEFIHSVRQENRKNMFFIQNPTWGMIMENRGFTRSLHSQFSTCYSIVLFAFRHVTIFS